MNLKSLTVLSFALIMSYTTFGQKRYYQNGKVIEDSLTYIANKEKDRTKYEAFAKPVVIKDNMVIVRSNKDSIVYSYKRGIEVGKSAEGKSDKIVFSESEEVDDSERDNLIGKEFPLPILKTIKGNEISIDKLKGRPTMINLWFTSCAPCIAEMPVLNKLKDKYGESVNFISLASDTNDKVEIFLKKRKFNFTHIVAQKFITDELKIEAFPKNIFLDKDGKVSKVEDGVPYIIDGKNEPVIGDGKEFELILDKLLKDSK